MRYNVITIEREYASGGREIGEKLAERLGIPCYGQEILEKAAAKIDLPLHELRALEESMSGSFLFGLNMFTSITSGKFPGLTSEQKLAVTEADIVRELSLNPCVMVGRSAAGLLKDNAGTLKVFIHADYDARIKRSVDIYRIDPKSADSVLRRCDKRRANYFKATTGVEWKDENNYHIFLNSSKLEADTIVDILYSIVK